MQKKSRKPQSLSAGDAAENHARCFAAEMECLGVQPLPGRDRQLPDTGDERPVAKPARQAPAERELFLETLGNLDSLFRDDVPEEQTDAAPAGHARPRRMRQLARGRLRPQAELNLHGLNATEAAARAGFFLEKACCDGLDCVLLITGKGLHSADGPVLRPAMERLLQEKRALVVEWGVAPQALGGSGALAVFLRKQR
ncbi:MAG: Smr/MutS family protein [Desulfuromonadales bacterium]|nr:Smr/MutS family protein [Desulfuromonadales bacterium]